jgi:hypothetical protein
VRWCTVTQQQLQDALSEVADTKELMVDLSTTVCSTRALF